MSSSQIKSVSQLLDWADKYEFSTDSMFRGQSETWPLLPGIGRSPLNEIVESFEHWESLHDHLLSRFDRYGQPFFGASKLSEIELLVLAQHYGLPTRLLDFTTNPLKALFFGCYGPSSEDKDGIVWMLNPRTWREDLGDQHKEYWNSEITAFFPPSWNARLIAQEGCFLCFPMSRDCTPINPLSESSGHADFEEIHFAIIPANEKCSLRRELRRLGISHQTLFPDLGGIARSSVAALFGE